MFDCQRVQPSMAQFKMTPFRVRRPRQHQRHENKLAGQEEILWLGGYGSELVRHQKDNMVSDLFHLLANKCDGSVTSMRVGYGMFESGQLTRFTWITLNCLFWLF